MLYNSLLLKFETEKKAIQCKTFNQLDEANLGCILCAKFLNKLKKNIIEHGFENKNREIDFFKNIKTVPMQYLIYYTEVRSFELKVSKLNSTSIIKHLDRSIKKNASFFEKHSEFFMYSKDDCTYLDKYYFTRKYLTRIPVVKSYPYYKDSSFNTSHDEIYSRIMGLSLFNTYLSSKKEKLLTPTNIKQTSLKWTGTYASFIEMIYGCNASTYFNDGNIEINKIVEELGDFLNIERGNSSRTYNELKNRKHSRIKFFEETGQKLLDKMDKEDAN